MNLALRRNLYNLSKFWQSFDAIEENGVHINSNWPNKQWRDDFSLPHDLAAMTVPSNKSYSTIANIDAPPSKALAIKMQVTLMNFSMTAYNQESNLSHPQIVTLSKDDATVTASDWAISCGQAFGYEIDSAMIQSLLDDPNAIVLAYLVDGQIAGTAIGYKTGDTFGVHQVGTLGDFRKMGIAVSLMQHLLSSAAELDVSVVSLQASTAGLPLYQRLGFETLGKLTSLVAAA